MADPLVLLDVTDGVATITLNNPKTLNALSPDMLDQLEAVLDQVTAAAGTEGGPRVAVLTGAGRGFCSGADLSPRSSDGADSAPPDGMSKAEARGEAVRQAMLNSFNPCIKKILDLPVPTISAVNGVAAGGGYGVALACDLVIAAESASFVLVFTPNLGILPDLGASWHPPRVLGRAKAMAAAFFGDRMSAAEAVDAGLIWKAVGDDALRQEVAATAQRLAAGPTRAYPAVRKMFDAASTHTLHDHLDMEADQQRYLIATDDYVEGVKAFQEKRKPAFKGT